MIKLRKAVESDKNRIFEISSTIWDGDDYIPVVFDRWLEDNNGELTVGELDGNVIGCAKYTRLNEKEAWLEGIRADKGYSGKGFGSAMTQYYIDKAKEEGIETLRLSTFIENYQSIHIIEKYGFKKDGYFSFYYKEVKDMEDAVTHENVINLMSASSVWHFITNSNFYMMSNGYISFGWKFVKLDYELLERLIKEGRVFGTLKEGKITAVLILGNEPTDPKGISIAYIDGNVEGIKKLLDYSQCYVKKSGLGFVSFMATLDDRIIDILEISKFNSIADNPRLVNVFVYTYKL